MSAARTHYEVLGVDAAADRETIRRAYLDIARANHPDRASAGDDRAASSDVMRRANEAWSILGDDARRRVYDESLRPSTSPTTGSAPVSGSDHPDAPRPAASGLVVPARTAPLWKWGPVVVILVILAALLIGSAYATSKDSTTTGGSSRPTSTSLVAGRCVTVGFSASGKVAEASPCDPSATGRIWSIVDSPRPCPSGTTAVELADGRTTLCLVPV